MNRLLASLCLAASAAFACNAPAAILLDWSPNATGAELSPSGDGSVLANLSTGINWAEEVMLPFGALITGMDIYTSNTKASLNQSVTIRFWDNPIVPTVFTALVSILDTDGVTGAKADRVRAHVDFGSNAFSVAANQFFLIGMSGTDSDLGLYGLTGPNAPGDEMMLVFNGDVPDDFADVGDMAFRLHGNVSRNVPDSSSTLALLALGAFGIAWFRRVSAKSR